MMVDLSSVLPLVMPGLAIWLWYLRTRRRFSVGRLVALASFAVYLLLVSQYTLFPLRFDAGYIDTFRSQTRFLDGVNLVPFKGWSLKYLMSVQGWGNVVLGMPWGFLYPFVVPALGWRPVARSGVIFSAGIELTQLLISLIYGFAYRVIDINDVLLNSTGVMIGYALLGVLSFFYRAVSGANPRNANPQDREDRGFWRYIKSVLLEHGRSSG
jgi:glycopeptide antibiotics resistance protein